MGTESEQLQQEIKKLIKQLGWSQKRFARELFAMTDEADTASEEEVTQYEERVKKQREMSGIFYFLGEMSFFFDFKMYQNAYYI